MKLSIANDLHCFAPNELMDYSSFLHRMHGDKQKGYFTVNLGDNFDLANCKKDDVKLCERLYDSYYDNRDYFDISLNGNHERYESKYHESLRRVVHSGIMFTHGDFEFWGYKKAMAYRRKPRGASFFKRGTIVKGIEWFEKNFESRIDSEFFEEAYIKCLDFRCHTYICGHKHPDETVIENYKGCKIIVLKRGINYLEV